MGIIEVKNLCKDFKVYQQQRGLKNVIKNLFRRDVKIVNAVNDISFSINEGEIVGFIGENGAGKSTTIKIMSGILYPTSGEAVIKGIIPYKQRQQNAMNIGVVFGQRSRLYWDLPILDSFELYKEIYKIDDKTYKSNVDAFVEMLDMSSYIRTPVRQLSLGQRMKAEISLSLLHNPPILYLDEPTIGLDVLAKNNIRKFILESNRKYGTTTILTSHDMKDLDKVCSKIIMISKGHITFDGKVEDFKNLYGGEIVLKITCKNSGIQLDNQLVRASVRDEHNVDITFNKSDMKLQDAISLVTNTYEIYNISVTEPDIEELVRNIFKNNMVKSEDMVK